MKVTIFLNILGVEAVFKTKKRALEYCKRHYKKQGRFWVDKNAEKYETSESDSWLQTLEVKK